MLSRLHARRPVNNVNNEAASRAGTPRGRLTIGRKDDVGTDSATPADWAAAPPRLNVQCARCFLLLGACSYFWFPTFAVAAENHAGHTRSSAIQRLLFGSRYGVP